MSPDKIAQELSDMTDGEAVVYPEYEEALVGICRQFGRPPVALYDYDLCVELLMRDGASHQEAVEWLETNTLGAWVGDHTPAFMMTSSE